MVTLEEKESLGFKKSGKNQWTLNKDGREIVLTLGVYWYYLIGERQGEGLKMLYTGKIDNVKQLKNIIS